MSSRLKTKYVLLDGPEGIVLKRFHDRAAAVAEKARRLAHEPALHLYVVHDPRGLLRIPRKAG